MSFAALFFIIISSAIYLVGFIPYIYHVFHGRVVPHPFSWTVWLLFGINSGYILYLDQGLSISIIPILVRVLALSIGAVIGWIYFKKISPRSVDYIALSLAIITIIVSGLLGASSAMVLMIVIDFLVLFPTLRKIWDNPVTEDPLAWIMAGFSQLFMIFSLQNISFSSTGYFIYNVLINFVVAILIYRRTEYISTIHYRIKRIINIFVLKKKLW